MSKDIINIRRKSFAAEAILVTPLNIIEVAQWCKGKIMHDGNKEGEFSRDYIKVRVAFPMNDRQTEAHIGDIVVKQKKTFKVYNSRALRGTFEMGDGTPIHFDQEAVQPAVKKPNGPTPGNMPKKMAPAPEPVKADVQLVKDNENNKAVVAAQELAASLEAEKPTIAQVSDELTDMIVSGASEEDLKAKVEESMEIMDAEKVQATTFMGVPPGTPKLHDFIKEEPTAEEINQAVQEEILASPEPPKSITLDELNDQPEDYTPTPGELYRGEA